MPERDLAKLHEQALERFKVTAHAEEKQRERELVDLKFADPIEPEDQWPKDALDSRAGLPSQGSLPPVPPRPALTINKLRQPIQQVQQQQRQARLSLKFAPEGEQANEDDAEAFEDIARAIQTDSRAHLARNWAFDRAVNCGRGFYRIETEYVNDRSFDQRIVYKRIKNQFCVYFYPFCQEPDFSDAEWAFVTEDLPLKEYQRKYPSSALAAMDNEELSAIGNEQPGWVSENDEGKTVRIAEYYFFETVADTLLLVEFQGQQRAMLQSELPKGFEGRILRQRGVEVRQLRWGKLNGVEFLKEPEFESAIVERDGRFIPIIPVIADESNINGETRYTGIVRPAMDAQRLFNVEASSLAEAVHLGPVAPFIGYPNQFEGFEAWWAQMNTRRFPFLPVNPPRNQNEAALPVPQRNTAEQPIEAIVVSLQQADNYIKATTGIFDPSLGNLSPSDRSGKAIVALQKQAEVGTAGYVDNLANMSMLLEGKILRDLIPKIYDRKGRVVAAEADDDERRTVLLGVPFVRKDGQAVPAQPGEKGAQIIDLQKGQYAVAATVGKSTTTKREEAVEQMGEIAQAMPQYVPAFADLWVKNMDGPGFRQIADRLAKAVPPQFRDDPNGQPDPQALMAQMQQAQQIIDLLSKELQAKTELIEKDQLKHETDLIKTAMEDSTRIEVARINQEGAFAVADLKAGLEAANVAIAEMQELRKAFEMSQKQVHEASTQGRDHAHEVRMATLQHQQALQLGHQQHAQALEQGVQDHAQALEQGAQQQQGALEQQAQAAALQPPPADEEAQA